MEQIALPAFGLETNILDYADLNHLSDEVGGEPRAGEPLHQEQVLALPHPVLGGWLAEKRAIFLLRRLQELKQESIVHLLLNQPVFDPFPKNLRRTLINSVEKTLTWQ